MKYAIVAMAALFLLAGCGKKEGAPPDANYGSATPTASANAQQVARDSTTSERLYSVSQQGDLSYISFYNTSDVMLVKTTVGGTKCVVGKVYGDPATSLSCDWNHP